MFSVRPSAGGELALQRFEAHAENGSEVQATVLLDILKRNAGVEYLRRHGLGGGACTDIQVFKSTIPVVQYADIAADVQRIANGDKSPILSADPVEKFLISSGTSAGKSKLIPSTRQSTIKSMEPGEITPVIRERTFKLSPDAAATLAFVYAATRFQTKSGLPAGTTTSSYFHSDEFLHRNHKLDDLTSPDEIILGADFKQVVYCHLLSGLLRREEVGVIMSFFAYMVVEAIRTLETAWKELCEDLRTGSLSSKRVTDPVLRRAMREMLRVDPELADLVERVCTSNSCWDGILGKLWPNVKFVLCIMTGAMAPYVTSLRQSAGTVPLVNWDYGASEFFPIGINLNPLDPPEKVLFTLVPTGAYIELSSEKEQAVVDLKNVKIGETYEIIVTTYSGLYRYRMGDLVKVHGFYKSLPQFSFVRRMNVLLSINSDKTDEMELQLVVQKASELLIKGSMEMVDYTSYADLNSRPGHYVIFVELKNSSQLDNNILQMGSSMIDSSFNNPYQRGRTAQTIGPLELCIVARGTFSNLLECAIQKGASASQFKTPRCINSEDMLKILQENTVAQYFSPAYPEVVMPAFV